ncbi:MAG: RNA methyltransferase [Planctomycetota bacterium]|jgi:tRNA G18 (ribose-2'-O)-methylase SpoU|nr:RNA methyltransferase [Planctomycetota bacterium]
MAIPLDQADAALRALFADWTDPELPARAGLVVAEGAETVRWLLASPWTVRAVLAKPSLAFALEQDCGQVPVLVAEPAAQSALLGFKFTRGILAVAERPPARALTDWLPQAPASCGLMIADGIHDPANIGALIRSARCLGLAALLLGPGCGDPFYRRAVRVSVGHAFHLPILASADLTADLEGLAAAGFQRFAAHRGPMSCSLRDCPPAGPRWALVVGNEDRGPQPSTLAHCDTCVAIDMATGVDSLNVTVAAGILAHALREGGGASARGHS